MDALKQFEKQQYMNLETVRKNGQVVKTPVWFAQNEETLHVWTFSSAGKIKRIRNNGSVRIAPSTASGEPVGDWVNAQATASTAPEAIQHIEQLMKKKYGFSFMMFNMLGKLRKSKTAVIKITVGAG
ncbi:MAG: PPOX class F420-dependent oxidoreductase [Chloroflexi bacterium]|nr:PPOX class F420-dependent oxidoreductase [Chloroflexota bacterium]